jgi:hypothetical protein
MKDAGELFTEITLLCGASTPLTSASVRQSLAELVAAIAQITSCDMGGIWSAARFPGSCGAVGHLCMGGIYGNDW